MLLTYLIIQALLTNATLFQGNNDVDPGDSKQPETYAFFHKMSDNTERNFSSVLFYC